MPEGLSIGGVRPRSSFSAPAMRVSSSRIDVKYSSILRRSEAPRSATTLPVLSLVRSRMLLRYRARRARTSGDRLGSMVPNKRSNTDRGFTSGGIGVSVFLQERLLVYAQLNPVSQLPTMRV